MLFLLCSGMTAAQAHAQAAMQPDGHWRGTGGATVSASSGNSESTSVLLNLDMSRLTAADKASVGGAYDYGRNKTEGVTTHSAKRWNVFGQYDYNLGARSFDFGKESSHELTGTTSLKQRLEVAPGLSGDKATLTRFTSGLSVAMNQSLSLTMGLTVSHNSAPPAGREATDTLLFTGINLKLGRP